jgi:prolyl oligopeptidase PreP (S9A serine peptidase family)
MILPRRANVIEDYHGTRVADPFRWMEDPEAAETRDFVAAHNQVTRQYLDNIGSRQRIKQRLTELWKCRAFPVFVRLSPLHNVKFGTVYPPTMIMTAESDDRVVPMHSLKFAAALHWAAGNPRDIYLRVESRAGHGHGKPTGKIIDEHADIFAFLFERLGVE